MNWLRQLFHKHTLVEVARCHRQVGIAAKYPQRIVWIDKHDVANLIRCVQCGAVLKPAPFREKLLGPKD